MREYLYIDESRILAYHEQCSSPVTYDKVPLWKVAIGLTNFGVEAQQSRVARQSTLHEKIEAVTKHLNSKGLLERGRISHRAPHEVIFGQEILNARRLRLTKTEPTLWLWYSDDEVQRLNGVKDKSIFLVEDYRSDDSDYVHRFTGMSSLMLLYGSLSDTVDLPYPTAHEAFGQAPLETLRLLGAEIGEPHRIETIYRLRACCIAKEDGYHSRTTIAYPIAIWAT